MDVVAKHVSDESSSGACQDSANEVEIVKVEGVLDVTQTVLS